MTNPENRTETLTPRSVESLYILNSVRDYLHLYTDYLKKLGVEQIVAFGSVVRGEAVPISNKKGGKPSDIDLAFILKRENGSLDNYLDYDRRRDLTHEFIERLSKHLKSHIPLHCLVSYMKNDGIYPQIVEDPVPLWEVATSARILAEAQQKWNLLDKFRALFRGN